MASFSVVRVWSRRISRSLRAQKKHKTFQSVRKYDAMIWGSKVRDVHLLHMFFGSLLLDSAAQDSDDVASVVALTAHCSAPRGNPGWGTALELVSEDPHSRKGWTGESHSENTDSELDYRPRGRSGNLQASPVWEAQGERMH